MAKHTETTVFERKFFGRSKNGMYPQDGKGKPTPFALRVFAQHALLKALCETNGYPIAFPDAASFAKHYFRDQLGLGNVHGGYGDPADTLVLSLTIPTKGLVVGNISVTVAPPS